MKRFLSLLLVMILCLLTGCGSSEAETAPETLAETTLAAESQSAEDLAEGYLAMTAFSRSGLIEQLVFDGFSEEEANNAVDALEIDWMKESLRAAASHLEMQNYSRNGMLEALSNDGFTEEEAACGAENCGADWMEQAVLSGKLHLSFEKLSREEMIAQLVSEGFTEDEAAYGADENGL